MKTVCSLLACALLCAGLGYSQVSYGHIIGRVTDPSGAIVPQATVEVINIRTNVVASTRTNTEGNFEVRNLIPGEYRLTVTLAGFKRYERGPLELRVGDTLNIPVPLEVGTQTESVTVTTESPLLETASASLGQVLDERRIQDLPLPASNPGFLIQFAPNVISFQSPTSTWTPEANPHPINYSAAGTSSAVGNNEMALDGMPNMRAATMGVVPPPEIVQEMRVETAAYDASLGHFTGSQVNMVLKSGTNNPHGDLVFSHNSRPFNAVPFFTNKSIYDLSTGPPDKAKVDRLFPFTRVNRYRGTGGGPVYIPKIYDGRNRTFWQYAADYMYMPYSTNSFWTIPTLKQRTGDFSELLAVGSNYQIYDPFSTVPTTGGRFSRSPVPGNIIPPNKISPIAARMIEYYPSPNATPTVDGRNNYTGSPNSFVDYNSHFFRVDQVLAPNHRMYMSYNQYHVYALQNIYYGVVKGIYPTGSIQDNWHHAVTLDDVMTLTPNLVLNLRYGLMRFSTKTPSPTQGYDLAALGIAPEFVKLRDPKLTTLPSTSITGYQGMGGGSGGFSADTFHNFFVTANHLRGKHSLRFGTELRVFQRTSYSFGNISPSYTFGTTWTSGPLNTSAASPIGQGLASFLYGLPTSGSASNNASSARSSRTFSWFIQDNWKLTPKLNLNLGIRHELEFPVHERFNRAVRGFDFATANPIQPAAQAAYALNPIPEIPASQFRTPGGLLYAGVGGVPTGMTEINPHNFLPRIGITYQLFQRTVLRAGYGIFFGSFGADRVGVTQTGFSQNTTLTASKDNGQTYVADIRNPFPDGLLEPVGSSKGLRQNLGSSVSFTTPKDRHNYQQRWSFNIQQDLGHRVLLELGYTGNRGTALAVSQDYGSLPIRYLSRSPVRDQATIDYLAAAYPNPFLGMEDFAGSSMTGNTRTRAQLLSPYPHFTGVSSSTGEGFSWYHAFSARTEKRFSHGYTVQISYTWSKYMEAVTKRNGFDDVLAHSISSADRPHHVAISAIYELPFGRGRRWLSALPRWADGAAGGWQVQAVFIGQNGPALSFGNIIFYGNLHDIVLPVGQRTPERWFNIDAGFERNSARQLGSNYVTFPMLLTGARADGINAWNMSILKNIPIWESVRFEVRAEAKNALNHTMFGGPNTGVTSTLFGQVTGSQGARQITMQGKFSW